jgi:hypothetical protein
MAIYTRQTIPEQVRSGIMDPEIKAWLKTGPVLGAHEVLFESTPHGFFILS